MADGRRTVRYWEGVGSETGKSTDLVEGVVERSRLIQLLAGEGEVRLLSRSALSFGAPYEVWPEAVSTQRLLAVYERRQRGTRRSGQSSIGFGDALDALRAYGGADLSIGFIDDRNRGGYYFQLFMDTELNTVVACLGVESPRGGSTS